MEVNAVSKKKKKTHLKNFSKLQPVNFKSHFIYWHKSFRSSCYL